jgi:hypothetical protein
MDLFHWLTYPSEFRYLTVVYGCKVSPTLSTLSAFRLYTTSFRRYPTIDEFLAFVCSECEPECEFFVPYNELVDLSRFSLVEYGFLPKCRLAHYMYQYRIFEHHYPSASAIHDYLLSIASPTASVEQDVITELAQRDIQEYWEKKQSGLTEQDIYKYVQTNEQKENMCCVCQEEIAEGSLAVRLDCGHSFHRGQFYLLSPEDKTSDQIPSPECQGVEEWLKRSATCPICRSPVK